MPPKVLAKSHSDRSSGAPGVLPVPASARAPPQKNQNVARLKLEVRRLPPGLTIQEFDDVLGSEWRLGGGKVDWRDFRQGKIRKSNKLPEMGRCYVHVTNENLVREFEKRFLGVKFEDQAGTFKDRDIRNMGWLPQLGFAPNQRVPAMGRQRQDQRQGTIDQDSEFMAFLEGETQLIAKPATVDAASERDKDAGEVRSTPLIDDLRERKAKAEQKKRDSKEGGGKGKHGKGESKDAAATTEKEGRGGQAQKGEQTTKGSKASNKQGGAKQAHANASAQSQAAPKGGQSPAKSKRQQSAAAAQSPKPQTATPTPSSPASSRPSSSQGPAPQRNQPTRQRGNAEGIKKMLQKDLGIQPKGGQGRQQRGSQNTSNNATSSTASGNIASQQTENVPAPGKNATAQQAPSQGAAQAAQPSQASSASSTKAYLKHANPSQGITEILLQTTLSRLYGPVSNVTIDPRKGTAIAVFKNTTDLKKAIEAKKVQIANGAVEIVEWKERSAGGGGAGGGGGGGGGGGSGGWGGSRGGFRGSRGGRGGRTGGASGNANGGGSGGNKTAAPANASSGT
ncbi:hypothetical protein K431DRAFT_282612 [Polychaeton citri CBS 116435]|uniref:UPF3 domain-containing protein n=1 Tax=Polychaeton citri CBS 116435 TaxID=1314669 RepID=A0A9P4QB36_9PEZI|nr:hypothetical protein K431DRAFT_282612 [Polychaeton citri CBS 116435]